MSFLTELKWNKCRVYLDQERFIVKGSTSKIELII